ncbi:MAG: exopolysaccharide Pel transporter PelG [Planctomycetota bacterium]
MAGIGFELRRMIDQRGGFLSKVRAYAAAGLISSGPWLMTILTLTLLNLLAPRLGVNAGISMFRALVTYSFAFSLVLVGAGQMAITRGVADHLYAHRYGRVLPAFTASMLFVGVASFVIASVFCAIAQFSPALSLVAVSLFMIISMTWLALTWLSVAREYDMVLRAYVYGTLVSVGGIAFCSITTDTVGILAAYTAGQAFTLMLLTTTIVRGMEADGRRDFTIFRALRSFPRLVGVGLFYNLAIWVDKMIFWFRDGVGPHEMVQYHPLYDTCCFLAYLTVVPALAVNLVRLETSFYETYRAYYGAILAGTPLEFIEDKRNRMFETLQESTVRLLRVQGAISILLIIFAPYLIEWLELKPVAVRVFRLACLGAFFHVMLLIVILMQMYFDLRRQAMGTTFVFLVLNAGMAWWSVDLGVGTYGIGYVTASFISLLLGYSLLHRSLEKLDYLTFTGQPIDDGSSPLDNSDELDAERKRSAAAATGEGDSDEGDSEDGADDAERWKDTDTEPFTDSEPARAPAQPLLLPVRDPVVYPMALVEVERLAARQMERTPAPLIDLHPDPFHTVFFDETFAEFDPELEEELDRIAEEASEHPEPNSMVTPSPSQTPEHATPPQRSDTATDFSDRGGGSSPTATEIDRADGEIHASEPDTNTSSDPLSLLPPTHATPPQRSGAAADTPLAFHEPDVLTTTKPFKDSAETDSISEPPPLLPPTHATPPQRSNSATDFSDRGGGSSPTATEIDQEVFESDVDTTTKPFEESVDTDSAAPNKPRGENHATETELDGEE